MLAAFVAEDAGIGGVGVNAANRPGAHDRAGDKVGGWDAGVASGWGGSGCSKGNAFERRDSWSARLDFRGEDSEKNAERGGGQYGRAERAKGSDSCDSKEKQEREEHVCRGEPDPVGGGVTAGETNGHEQRGGGTERDARAQRWEGVRGGT